MTSRTTSWIPVTIDVPFATAIMGFRPRILPPLPREELGIPLGHIHPGHWAERIGLKEGDIITHVNGRSVVDMSSGDEFLQAVSTRPLRLTVQIGVSAGELSDILQSFDWSARLEQIEKATKGSTDDPKQTDEIFERVFTEAASYEEKSSLFDFTKWLGTGKQPAETPKPTNPPTVQITPSSPPSNQVSAAVSSSPVEPPKKTVEIMKRKQNPPSTRTIVKWVASHPLCVRFKIEQGFNLPERAGTLGLDYYLQPFSSEPFLELSLVASPGRDVTMNEILDSKPIEARAVLQTPVCDSNSRWDYSGSLLLISEAFTEGDVMLVGKLMDYRRLEAPRPMGVFAIRLDALEISDDIEKVSSSLISLSLIDAYTFDVSKSKIKMSLCLKGRQVTHSESIRQKSAPQSKEQSIANTPQSSPSLISSPVESEQSPEVESVPESDAPLLTTTVEATKIAYQTPFQRAYKKALSDIKRGDNSPIRSQHYTLR